MIVYGKGPNEFVPQSTLVNSLQQISLEQTYNSVPDSAAAEPGEAHWNEGYVEPSSPPVVEQEPVPEPSVQQQPYTAPSPPPARAPRKVSRVVDLPPPDSDEWETMQLPPPSVKKSAARVAPAQRR